MIAQTYTACLGEALRRLTLMRESKAFKAARMFKGKDARKRFCTHTVF